MKLIKSPLLIIVILAAAFIFALHNCKSETETTIANTHPYPFPEIPWFPSYKNIPADNPHYN